MAFYYVKNDGTATGDAGRYASRQTGSFATLGTANYYASVTAAQAATTAPVAGDEICISDVHSETTAATITLMGAVGTSALPIKYISVSDSNMDQAAVAAAAQINVTGASSDIRFGTADGSRQAFHGLWLKTENDNRCLQSNSINRFRKCTLEATGPTDIAVSITGDGSIMTLEQCTVLCGDSATIPVRITGAGTVRMIGGSVTKTTGNIDNLIDGGAANGGFNFQAFGVDISKVSGYLFGNGGNAVTDDTIDITIDGCKINASLTGFIQQSLYGPAKNVSITRSSSSSAAASYQFYKNSDQHTVQQDTTFYRDSSTAFTDSGQKVSMKVVTAANADRVAPFFFELPARYAELSSASSDTLRLYLLSSDSGLTNNDVWANIIYPDGTNKEVFNFLSTTTSDPIGTGTALTANSDSWTGRTTETRYQIDLDTSGDPGADCAPILRILVGKPSLTVYIDTTVDVVA